MTFTDQELIAIHQGIVKVNLTKDVISASDKVKAELKARGYSVEYVRLPKRPRERKNYYEWQYIKQA